MFVLGVSREALTEYDLCWSGERISGSLPSPKATKIVTAISANKMTRQTKRTQ